MGKFITVANATAAMAVAITAYGLGRARAQTAGKTVQSAHVTITVPSNWERKPNMLAFRLNRGSGVIRFLVVDEVPAKGVSSDATVKELRAAFPADDRIVDKEHSDFWQGHKTLTLEWHGTTKQGTPIRGEERFIALKGLVVTVLSYAPTDQGHIPQREFSRIISTMKFR